MHLSGYRQQFGKTLLLDYWRYSDIAVIMGNKSSSDKKKGNQVEPNGGTNADGTRKTMTNTDIDIGRNGPTQVVRQWYALPGAPVRHFELDFEYHDFSGSY